MVKATAEFLTIILTNLLTMLILLFLFSAFINIFFLTLELPEIKSLFLKIIVKWRIYDDESKSVWIIIQKGKKRFLQKKWGCQQVQKKIRKHFLRGQSRNRYNKIWRFAVLFMLLLVVLDFIGCFQEVSSLFNPC